MNSRGYSSNQVTKAMIALCSEKSLPDRLQDAKLEIVHFASESNCNELSGEALHCLQQLLEVKDFRALDSRKQIAATWVFIDFFCFAKRDFEIASYKEKDLLAK